MLILRDVLGYRANEVAAMLEATQESVTSALFAAVLPPGGHDYQFVRTRANGQPACAFYVRYPVTGMGRTLGLLVLTLAGDLISEVIRFDASVLGSFGLPGACRNPPGCPGTYRNPRSEFAADRKDAKATEAECSQEACRRRLLARCADRAGVCGDGAG